MWCTFFVLKVKVRIEQKNLSVCHLLVKESVLQANQINKIRKFIISYLPRQHKQIA